ncbi:hypothetical protein H4R33_003697 [Dimargaris cristalligena]|uniref:RING-type domain-containing protein n=1 Tax=Dimargaris cristalligena TaxID=215637 RepID=A0A4P9ZZ67_9FUNG|nr:hypothetical protein H4R33_003697 [Dimargaris cristalligena]RKP38698.1 hypothetical protein BJ085DRAFT_29953 [Dimargaris cristalligena]|eukprot:RKP38698.1 hypothetical protein BJ085DRAFT_29953 [Dimargaris cristalligena]
MPGIGDLNPQTDYNPETTRQGALIGGIIGGVLGFIILLLVGFCVYVTVRQRRLRRDWTSRRQRGIESLQLQLAQPIEPLDRSLIQYLRVVDIKREPLATLERAPETPRGEVSSGDAKLPLVSGEIGHVALPMGDPIPVGEAVEATQHFLPTTSSLNGQHKQGDPESTPAPADLSCTICRSALAKYRKVRQLPCLHIYHVECSDQWLLVESATCPTCGFDVRQYCLEKAKDHSHSPGSTEKNSFEKEPIVYVF